MADKKDNIVLSIRDMSKSFGRNRVLTRINLDVKAGFSYFGREKSTLEAKGSGAATDLIPTLNAAAIAKSVKGDESDQVIAGFFARVNYEALENGIAMVHQELNQCLERNVVDNLFLGRYPVNAVGVIDEGRMKKEASVCKTM